MSASQEAVSWTPQRTGLTMFGLFYAVYAGRVLLVPNERSFFLLGLVVLTLAVGSVCAAALLGSGSVRPLSVLDWPERVPDWLASSFIVLGAALVVLSVVCFFLPTEMSLRDFFGPAFTTDFGLLALGGFCRPRLLDRLG